MSTPWKLTLSQKKRIKNLASAARPRPALQQLQARRVEKLEKSLKQAEAALQRMRALAYLDDLCQIHNRRAFNEELNKVTDLAWRYGHVASVVIFDVNRFKEVNDNYGHAIGDLALIAVAQAIRSSVRASDFSARIGGDEFAIILHHIDEADAQAKADEICSLIASTQIDTGAGIIGVTASAGLSRIPRAGADQAFAAADNAMLRQKRASRTIYCFS